jgi:hypothetical protein
MVCLQQQLLAKPTNYLCIIQQQALENERMRLA